MKINNAKMNDDTGRMVADITFSDLEIILLQEIVKMYDKKRLEGKIGDMDDPTTDKTIEGLKQGLKEAFKRLRPS